MTQRSNHIAPRACSLDCSGVGVDGLVDRAR